jgi:hypothetical protein
VTLSTETSLLGGGGTDDATGVARTCDVTGDAESDVSGERWAALGDIVSLAESTSRSDAADGCSENTV